jgi:hypothetical protein
VLAPDGGDVDNLPTLLADHRWKHRFGAEEGSPEVGVDDIVPILSVGLDGLYAQNLPKTQIRFWHQ